MTKILIVEDEAITALDIQNILNNYGFDVIGIVSRGKDAIKQADELEPNLILMDINLKGDMDGIEAAREIKTLFNIPIIYMSAFTDKTTYEHIKLTNPYGFVSKPVSSELLLISIETALYKHELDKKLSEGEELLRLIFDSTQELICSTDFEGRLTSANKVLCETLNLREEKIIGKTFPELGFSKKMYLEWVKLQDKIYKTNNTVKFVNSVVMPDGEIHDYKVILNPIHKNNGEIVGISVICRDLTENTALKKELNEVGELFQNLYNNAQVGIVIGNARGRIIDCNSAFEEMLGYSLNELKKMHFTEFTHPDYIEKESSHLENLRTGKIKFYKMEKKFIRKDNKIIWGKVTGGFGISSNGKPINSLIVVENINERKKAEKEIKDYANHLKAIFDITSMALATTDTNGHWINVNKKFLDELGYSEEEFLRLTHLDITHPDDIKKTSESFSKLLSGEIDNYQLEKRYKTKDNEFKWFYLSINPIKNKNNEIVSVIGAGHPINKDK